MFDKHIEENHLKQFGTKVMVYSALLPGIRSCRTESMNPPRAAVLQRAMVLVTEVHWAGPRLEMPE